MQRAEALAVEPFGPLAQHRVVLVQPRRHYRCRRARRRRSRPQLGHRDILVVIRKYLLGQDALGYAMMFQLTSKLTIFSSAG